MGIAIEHTAPDTHVMGKGWKVFEGADGERVVRSTIVQPDIWRQVLLYRATSEASRPRAWRSTGTLSVACWMRCGRNSGPNDVSVSAYGTSTARSGVVERSSSTHPRSSRGSLLRRTPPAGRRRALNQMRRVESPMGVVLCGSDVNRVREFTFPRG